MVGAASFKDMKERKTIWQMVIYTLGGFVARRRMNVARKTTKINPEENKIIFFSVSISSLTACIFYPDDLTRL